MSSSNNEAFCDNYLYKYLIVRPQKLITSNFLEIPFSNCLTSRSDREIGLLFICFCYVDMCLLHVGNANTSCWFGQWPCNRNFHPRVTASFPASSLTQYVSALNSWFQDYKTLYFFYCVFRLIYLHICTSKPICHPKYVTMSRKYSMFPFRSYSSHTKNEDFINKIKCYEKAKLIMNRIFKKQFFLNTTCVFNWLCIPLKVFFLKLHVRKMHALVHELAHHYSPTPYDKTHKYFDFFSPTRLAFSSC